MELLVMVVLVSLAMLNPAEAQVNLTTLHGFFLEQYDTSLQELTTALWIDEEDSGFYQSELPPSELMKLANDLLYCTMFLVKDTAYEWTSNLQNVSPQSLYDDLNSHCHEYLETPLVDLREELRNTTCVTTRLREMVASELKHAMEVILQGDVTVYKWKRYCSMEKSNCIRTYQKELLQMINNFGGDANLLHKEVNSLPKMERNYLSKVIKNVEPTPLNIIMITVLEYDVMFKQLLNNVNYLHSLSWHSPYAENLPEPFRLENLLYKWANSASSSAVDQPCYHYRDSGRLYLWDLPSTCNYPIMLQSQSKLLLCDYSDQSYKPFTWSTAPSLYFFSPCLCVVTNGTNCGVKAPLGVDHRRYCFSVLLRDFQRQVWFRPAVTYLDYAFKTKVPVCAFSKLLSAAIRNTCDYRVSIQYWDSIIYSRCYFKELVNKDMNCSEKLTFDRCNISDRCAVGRFMEHVFCNVEVEYVFSYYQAGDSPLVLLLTYLDVAVRVLTLVTYLTCPQLRNLAGKLLMAYLLTALLRLLVVRASLEDLSLAVRLDVAINLSCTLWLSCYLHFLTVSIRNLRPPDSLSPAEARQVLFHYAMLGWALPAVLSTALFCTDEFLETQVQVGQLLFLVFNFMALFGNLYMFYLNFSFYYDLQNSVRGIERGVTARSIFAELYNFALKSSVLSAMEIGIRLIFTQIQGLEQLLGIYHALGTLQGLLIFLLFGCNQEARAFWVSVFRSSLRRCRRCQSSPPQPNSLEMVENSVS